MKLEENRSKIWFKVVAKDGKPVDGSQELWSFPFRTEKGDELDFSNQAALGLNDGKWIRMKSATGTWLVSSLKELYTSNSERKIFVAELLSPPVYELPGIIWVHKVRLVREATNLDLKRFGIHRAFGQTIG